MDLDAFIEATSPVAYLLNKALSSNLIIPEFPEFCELLVHIALSSKSNVLWVVTAVYISISVSFESQVNS